MLAFRLGDLAAEIQCPVLAMIGDREGPEPLAQFDIRCPPGPGDR